MTLIAKLEMGSFQAVKKVMLIFQDKCGRPLILPRLVVAKKPNFTEIFFVNSSSFFRETRSLKPLLLITSESDCIAYEIYKTVYKFFNYFEK